MLTLVLSGHSSIKWSHLRTLSPARTLLRDGNNRLTRHLHALEHSSCNHSVFEPLDEPIQP